MKYAIVFDKAIRLGPNVAAVIGPFATFALANEWLADANTEWEIKPPGASVLEILHPVPEPDPKADCTCKYVAAKVGMDTTNCKVHTKEHYKCGEANCHCTNYRPIAEPKGPRHDGLPGKNWPRCDCGHIAQMHD